MDKVVEFERYDTIAVVTINHPPVNALSAVMRGGIVECINATIADPQVNAIVLICAGRTFIAGADITEFGKPPKSPGWDELLVALENSPKPIVAAIHGNALGAGLEVALVCHFRVATQKAKLGLPEVKQGLLSGSGGTQRLPRIVGVERALEMMTSGIHVPAREALAMSLVDEIVEEGELKEGAIAFARRALAEGKPRVKVRENNAKLEAAKGHLAIFGNFRKLNARKFRGFLAPEYNIRCIEAAVNSNSFEEGLAVERELFAELEAGPQSIAQRYYFFAERQARKIPDAPDDTPTRPINKVGVLGAGTMGGGIAMNFANAGIPVTIVEIKQDALDRGLGVIKSNYERTAARGGLAPEQVNQRMDLLTGSLSLEDFTDCDLIIEAVFERMDIKKQVFANLDRICKPGAILATNTSELNVDEIASITRRPEDVIGLHFFSPANVMKLLEVVRGEKTAADVIASSMKLAKTIGKVAVLAGVCHGFIGNRMLNQREREAKKLVLEGASPWDVDRVLYDFGFPMGPFRMNDLAGLDLGWVIEESKSSTLREVLCEIGRLGQKAGAGYYDYDENRTAKPSPVTEKIIKDFIAKSGKSPRKISDEEIMERCIFPMINEGVKILEEGKALRASDIDVVWVNGYGWPVYRGGPMYYADQIGLEKILVKMKEFHAIMGDEFKPAPLLEKLVAGGKTFANFDQFRKTP